MARQHHYIVSSSIMLTLYLSLSPALALQITNGEEWAANTDNDLISGLQQPRAYHGEL